MIILLTNAYFRRQTPEWRTTTERIIAAVSTVRGIPITELITATRVRDTSYARHLAMYLAHKDGRVRIADLQRHFGNRNHATVIDGIARIAAELRTRPETQQDLEACRRALCTSTA